MNGWKHTAFCLSLIIGACFVFFGNTLFADFVSDDYRQILGNPWIKDPRHLKDIFTSHSYGFKEIYIPLTYRPMVFVVYMVEHALFGLKPWGWHFVNVCLHAVNSVLVFFLFRFLILEVNAGRGLMGKLLRRGGGGDDGGGVGGGGASAGWGALPALGAALIFAVHPVNSEVVTWVGCVPELFLAMLIIAAFHIHAGSFIGTEGEAARRRAPLRGYVLPACLFFVAVFFKETAVALPLIVFIYDLLMEGWKGLFRVGRLKRYVPYVIAAVVYIPIRINAMGYTVPAEEYYYYLGLSPFQYFLNAFPLFIEYLYSLVLPVTAYPYQRFYPVLTFIEPRVIVSILLTILIPALIIVFRRRIHPLLVLALSFIIIPLLPALYSIGLYQSAFGSRYLYIPAVGMSLIMCLLLKGTISRGRPALKRAPHQVLTATVLFYGGWAAVRNTYWKDTESMWKASLRGDKDNYIAVYYLGYIRLLDGDAAEGIRLIEKSRDMNTSSPSPDPTMLFFAHQKLAVAYEKKGLLDAAIREYNGYLELRPDDIKAAYNLATLYKRKGLFGQAILNFRTALAQATEPWQFKDIYTNMGDSFAGAGLWAEAYQSYGEALKYAPENVELLEKLALARSMARPGPGWNGG